MCWCEPKLSEDLIQYFNERFPGVLTQQNKRILIKAKTLTLIQLFSKLNVQSQIFTNIQAEQFRLEFEYIPRQQIQPIQNHPYSNDGYTYQIIYQEKFIQNVSKILVIGQKGSGKSSLINATANALLIGYPDRFRYHISDYDVDIIQSCDLEFSNKRLKFIEVPGYVNNEQVDQGGIMIGLYNYLRDKNFQIDLILFCRRNTNAGLNENEKRIIYNLVELFGQDFVTKFIIINTNFDLGQRHSENLIESLQRISNIYNKMPSPKIMFLNSNTTPGEGQAGYLRYETMIEAKNNILQILESNQVQLLIREQFNFHHRRELEESMRNTMKCIQEGILILLPHLENYYSIFDVNESDDQLSLNEILWNTFDPQVQRHDQYNVGTLLLHLTLSDAQQTKIRKQGDQWVQSKQLPPDHLERRLKEYIQKESDMQKFILVKQQTQQEKEQRVAHIISLAEDYINLRSEYQQGTFSGGDITVQELITNNLTIELKLFLQQRQEFYQPGLQQDFEQLRNQFFLPNDNLQATKILGGKF